MTTPLEELVRQVTLKTAKDEGENGILNFTQLVDMQVRLGQTLIEATREHIGDCNDCAWEYDKSTPQLSEPCLSDIIRRARERLHHE